MIDDLFMADDIKKQDSKVSARQAMLKMAKEWEKTKVQHAIEGYEAVIESYPESEEAQEAKESLLRIAQSYEKEGKKESAFHLYKKLAFGRAGGHNSG